MHCSSRERERTQASRYEPVSFLQLDIWSATIIPLLPHMEPKPRSQCSQNDQVTQIHKKTGYINERAPLWKNWSNIGIPITHSLCNRSRKTEYVGITSLFGFADLPPWQGKISVYIHAEWYSCRKFKFLVGGDTIVPPHLPNTKRNSVQDAVAVMQNIRPVSTEYETGYWTKSDKKILFYLLTLVLQ